MPVNQKRKNSACDLVGVVPAAGTASRLGPLPCSKELLPIEFQDKEKKRRSQLKVVSHYLLEKMRRANISRVFIILSKGKWDIPAYFGDGKALDMNLAYLTIDWSYGVPYTLDQGYPFVRNNLVALGFPDVLLKPQDSFIRLLNKQMETNSDVVLGLYPTDQPHKMDLVDLKKNGRIKAISVKPSKFSITKLRYAWQTAVWKPAFTEYLHTFVAEHKKRICANSAIKAKKHERELFMGNVLQAAIKDKFNINSVVFPEGDCLDIGTPEDLVKTLQKNFCLKREI
jgi:glucose-1-phosphate thymidylyltransferase